MVEESLMSSIDARLKEARDDALLARRESREIATLELAMRSNKRASRAEILAFISTAIALISAAIATISAQLWRLI